MHFAKMANLLLDEFLSKRFPRMSDYANKCLLQFLTLNIDFKSQFVIFWHCIAKSFTVINPFNQHKINLKLTECFNSFIFDQFNTIIQQEHGFVVTIAKKRL